MNEGIGVIAPERGKGSVLVVVHHVTTIINIAGIQSPGLTSDPSQVASQNPSRP